MLSEKTIGIVKSTAPVLEVKGKEITTHFYKTMFEAHPELLHIFNHANQQKGRQQTALANTVTAAAKYIDQLEVLLPVVKQIAHKHRSLAIKAEHYPIVGEFLLKAIKEVLGDAATEEILQAWAEAYGAIADIFIQVEKEMYEEAEQQKNGWKDFKPFRIVDKVKESQSITSFYLAPADGQGVPSFSPGQYVSLRINIDGETYLQNRQYSLSDSPNEKMYRISVKREDEGTPAGKVSNYLHECEIGYEVEVSAPAGDFVLDFKNRKPAYLISGGVGVTPLLSMLKTIVANDPEQEVTFIHAAKNSNVHAFGEEVKDSVALSNHARNYLLYSEPTSEDKRERKYDQEGYIDQAFLESVVKENDGQFYVCGPVPFIKAVVSELKQLEVKTENIHYEFFGPAINIEEPTPVQ
ncbi:NO-inducible flavohemoprotein [Halalkalibacter alkalisediminis]|uniref:Flavohemoprotein n=1 Tax=Halalkalibacter alkalisediminis TaxID=935616 RepID=A0ABV6NBT6_9BACI|nr:NO-inducible flavohemoprotein [Halalkalibacter alkalisediminis]